MEKLAHFGHHGGMVPWHHDNHPALKWVNQDPLAWIANEGTVPDPSRPDARLLLQKTIITILTSPFASRLY